MEKFRVQIIENHCPEMRYLLTSQNEISVDLLSSRDSVMLLHLKNEAFSTNLHWLDNEVFPGEISIELNPISHSGREGGESDPILNFICPYWNGEGQNTFKFTISDETKPNFKLSVGRLLEGPKENGQENQDKEENFSNNNGKKLTGVSLLTL